MRLAFSYIIGSLLLLGGAASCQKEDAAPQTDFFVKALKSSAPWTASGTATYSKARQQFYVFGQSQTGNAARAEVFTLGFALPAAPQLAPVQALSASWRVLVGYDVVVDSYATANAAGLPAVEVTRLDTVSKVVEGRFHALLLRDKHWTSQTEIMGFEDGSFRVQYTTVP